MKFKANNDDAWWFVDSVTEDNVCITGIKNFRVMFQVGDEDSDWEGVKFQIDSTKSDTYMLDEANYDSRVKEI